MAKKKTAVKALSGPRLMMQELMHYVFRMGSPAALWTFEKNGYRNYQQTWNAPGYRYLVGSTYFDLSGYTRNHLTTYPNRITTQEGGSFRMKEDSAHAGPPPLLGSPQTGAIVLDLMTEEPLTEAELAQIAQQVEEKEVAPSFADGPLEFQQVIYGRYRMMGHDTTVWTPAQGNLSVINETQFGSGSPTTTDKLWIYRIIVPMGIYLIDTDDYVIIPPIRYLMSATIDEESDASYMMRQKRSFELAT